MQTQTASIQQNTSPQDMIFPIIQDIIVHVLTLDPDEITLDTSFEEDLDIMGTPWHMKVVAQIKAHFKDLPDLRTDELMSCETVAELVSLIEDEKELEQDDL